jgi:hypothetical protein
LQLGYSWHSWSFRGWGVMAHHLCSFSAPSLVLHSFMAPETFIKDLTLTPAVDIYAFGVLMYELLMGRSVS